MPCTARSTRRCDVARIQFSATAPRVPGLSLPMSERPTIADMAQACAYWHMNTPDLGKALEVNDAARTQLVLYVSLNRSRHHVTYAEAGEFVPGEDFEFITEPGDEPAADDDTEDPPQAPSDSASDEDGAAAMGRHSLTA